MSEKIEAIIFGIGSLFNIWGNQIPMKVRTSSFNSDSEEIRKDFCAVGRDMYEVISDGK